MKSEKQRWCVIHFGGAEALVTIDKKNPNNFHWFGSVSYCSFNEDSYIVEELGIFDELESDKLDELEINFYKKYNIPESYIEQSGGWLAPDGKFFPCSYYQHDGFARSLAAIYYNSLGGTRVLELNNWIRVYDDGNVGVEDYSGFLPTQKQIDTLYEILSSISRDEEYGKTLKENFDFWLTEGSFKDLR
jgi:hypothetical protein